MKLITYYLVRKVVGLPPASGGSSQQECADKCGCGDDFSTPSETQYFQFEVVSVCEFTIVVYYTIEWLMYCRWNKSSSWWWSWGLFEPLRGGRAE